MSTPVHDHPMDPPARPVEAPRSARGVRSAPNVPTQPRIGLADVVLAPARLMLRIFCPRLLDRYVMGELLAPLAFGWSLFIILFVLAVNMFRLAAMLARGAPLPDIGEMLWLRMILASVYCLPMAMLMAGLLAFGRLSGDSELVATQAGGVTHLRIIRNCFILGLALSFLGLGVNEYIIPPAARRLDEVEDKVEEKIKGRILEDLMGNRAFVYQENDGPNLARVVVAKRFEPEDPPNPATMHDVTYMSYQEGKLEMVVEAKKALWLGQDKKENTVHHWRFLDANSQMMMRLTPGRRVMVHSVSLDFTLRKSPREVMRAKKDAQEMSYVELKEYIKGLHGENVRGKVIRELEVAAEQKLAIPFAALVLALIGPPLGIRKQRSTTGIGVGLSLLVMIMYYVGMGFLGILGSQAQLEPVAAAWGCNVIGLALGLFLAWRSSR
jgi:lipopolysaccharide export system permease protein